MFKFDLHNKTIGVISLEKPSRITGEISASFRKWYESKEIGKCSAIVIDGENIQFIDSMGIAALISIYKNLTPKGSNLLLVNLSPEIKKLLGTLRLDRLFNIRDCSVEDAIKTI
ncbi:STAS domain-containing protein [Mesotoga prima]|jgi:anti-sigma B factor antagonist|uniref:STAS domain-containing protein n=1 Tax=Mesotoga prima TaxID=1184387 RepID=UPI002FE2B579